MNSNLTHTSALPRYFSASSSGYINKEWDTDREKCVYEQECQLCEPTCYCCSFLHVIYSFLFHVSPSLSFSFLILFVSFSSIISLSMLLFFHVSFWMMLHFFPPFHFHISSFSLFAWLIPSLLILLNPNSYLFCYFFYSHVSFLLFSFSCSSFLFTSPLFSSLSCLISFLLLISLLFRSLFLQPSGQCYFI